MSIYTPVREKRDREDLSVFRLAELDATLLLGAQVRQQKPTKHTDSRMPYTPSAEQVSSPNVGTTAAGASTLSAGERAAWEGERERESS